MVISVDPSMRLSIIALAVFNTAYLRASSIPSFTISTRWLAQPDSALLPSHNQPSFSLSLSASLAAGKGNRFILYFLGLVQRVQKEPLRFTLYHPLFTEISRQGP
jgi:hypothetical protein